MRADLLRHPVCGTVVVLAGSDRAADYDEREQLRDLAGVLVLALLAVAGLQLVDVLVDVLVAYGWLS